MMSKTILYILCTVVGALVAWVACRYHYEEKLEAVQNARLILISKQDMKLRLLDYKGKELFEAGIACGLNYGNKSERGDMKTPEGVFSIADIQKTEGVCHDFRDGNGVSEHAYGAYFIRLAVPGHKGIGIHGTHDPQSIGTRVTEGCVRLKNEDLEKLVPMLEVPMTVVITPSATDEMCNSNLPQ